MAVALTLVTLGEAGCTDLDPDYAADPDIPLFYSCETNDDCASGAGCAADVALVAGRDGLELRGLCVPADAGDPSACGPSPILERRAATPGGAGRCLFPLQCAEGMAGVELEGDALGCPLGFRCADDDPDCVACGFVSCDMAAYAADSATLTGVDGGARGCVEPLTGDRPPFTDSASGRVYCKLAPGPTYSGCPAGWRPVSSLPAGCGGAEGDFCYIIASIASDTSVGEAALAGASGEAWVEPAYVMPQGSAMSCRPVP